MAHSHQLRSLTNLSAPLQPLVASGAPSSEADVKIEVQTIGWNDLSTHFLVSGSLVHAVSKPVFLSLSTPSLTPLYFTTNDSLSSGTVVHLGYATPHMDDDAFSTPFTIHIPPHLHQYPQSQGACPMFAVVARFASRGRAGESSVLRFAVAPPPPVPMGVRSKRACTILPPINNAPTIDLDSSTLYVPSTGRMPTLSGRISIPIFTSYFSPTLRLYQDGFLHNTNNFSSLSVEVPPAGPRIRWTESQDDGEFDDSMFLSFSVDIPRSVAPSPGESTEWVLSLDQNGCDVRAVFRVVGAFSRKPSAKAKIVAAKKRAMMKEEGIKKVKSVGRGVKRYFSWSA